MLSVCTVVHPAAMPFFGQYWAGLSLALEAYGRPAKVIHLVDGVPQSTIAACGAVLSEMVTHVVRVANHKGPPAIRRQMLDHALEQAADTIVLIDADDVPCADMLNLHTETLVDADISFGDMHLIDQCGVSLERTFLENAAVPEIISGCETILDRNFLGFTNTAIKSVVAEKVAPSIPDDVVAADWWMFTEALANGFVARRTRSPVVSYRTHEKSLVGGLGAKDLDSLRRQVEIVSRHYGHHRALSQVDERCLAIADFSKALDVNPESVVTVIERRPSDVWYSEVIRAALGWGGTWS